MKKLIYFLYTVGGVLYGLSFVALFIMTFALLSGAFAILFVYIPLLLYVVLYSLVSKYFGNKIDSYNVSKNIVINQKKSNQNYKTVYNFNTKIAVDYFDGIDNKMQTGYIELDTYEKRNFFENGYATINNHQIPFENIVKEHIFESVIDDYIAPARYANFYNLPFFEFIQKIISSDNVSADIDFITYRLIEEGYIKQWGSSDKWLQFAQELSTDGYVFNSKEKTEIIKKYIDIQFELFIISNCSNGYVPMIVYDCFFLFVCYLIRDKINIV